jgi:hypothetical protein
MKRECGEIAKLTYQSTAFGWKFTLDLSVFDMARRKRIELQLNFLWIYQGERTKTMVSGCERTFDTQV